MRIPFQKSKSRKDATMSLVVPSHPSRDPHAGQSGFSLLELMVALGITLVITGSMYGLIASSQGAFRREPALSDRQQQIRIAMTRVREDLQVAGLGLGNYIQAFGENLDGVGITGAVGAAFTGVRPAGNIDPLYGSGLPDVLEIRAMNQDCPQVVATQNGGLNGNIFNLPAGMTYPPCYATPAYVLGIYPSGAAKWAVVAHDPAGQKFNFASNDNKVTTGSQFTGPNNFSCDTYLVAPADPCPAWATSGSSPNQFVKMDRIIYRLAPDTDGVPALFRSATGGFDNVAGKYNTLPPGPAWQIVARGIEDFQVRYRVVKPGGADDWQTAAPVIAPPSFDNVVREVEVTMWARTVGENRLQGQSVAAGNGVTAVRGSLTSTVAPRGAQVALMQEPDPAKRWQ
ncbi:MAG: prepilin-type N-terminal cleavage/methylation domain-containing protein [Vicinamibacteria bacterium]